MNTIAEYCQRIATACPGLMTGDTEVQFTHGQFNDVLFVGHTLVFRFPRTEVAAEVCRREYALLVALRGKLPLPIPEPLVLAKEVTDASPFLAYRRIPGNPLDLEALALHEAAERVVAEQLAAFLATMHSLPVSTLPGDLPQYDQAEQWEAFFAALQAELFPHMNAAAQRWTTTHFERYLGDVDLNAFTPVLRHGDFGGGNILYDSLAGRVSGIIDFESAGLGDPAADLAALSTLGTSTLAHCLKVYPAMELMLDRARFIRGTFALQEAYYGLRDGDQEAFRSGIEGVNAMKPAAAVASWP